MVGVGIVETASARFHVPHPASSSEEQLIYFRPVRSVIQKIAVRSLVARSTPTTYIARTASIHARREDPISCARRRPASAAYISRYIWSVSRTIRDATGAEKWEKWYIAIRGNVRGEKCINKDLSPSPIAPDHGYSLSPYLLALKD